jgi:hypothetical protein
MRFEGEESKITVDVSMCRCNLDLSRRRLGNFLAKTLPFGDFDNLDFCTHQYDWRKARAQRGHSQCFERCLNSSLLAQLGLQRACQPASPCRLIR